MFLVCSAGSEGASQSHAEWSSQNTTCQSGPQRISARPATERHQQTAANASMAGKWDFTGVHTGKPLPTCRCTVDKDKKKNTAMCGLWKVKWCLRGKQGVDYVLFCLDGVWWSHVVAGDITALASRQGTGEPPISFSVTWRGREKKDD